LVRPSAFVVSEENLLGVLQTRVEGRIRLAAFYHAARQRLAMLIPVLSPDQASNLCFAIRASLPGFLESAYGQVMMGGHVVARDELRPSKARW